VGLDGGDREGRMGVGSHAGDRSGVLRNGVRCGESENNGQWLQPMKCAHQDSFIETIQMREIRWMSVAGSVGCDDFYAIYTWTPV
jgi:hypothetical protein